MIRMTSVFLDPKRFCGSGLFSACALSTAALLTTGAALPAQAQQNLERSQYMGGIEMLRVFEPVVADVRRSVVSIRCDNRLAAFGAIISSDGQVITKASEMEGEIVCELYDGRKVNAQLVATDPITDLALLQVDASELEPLEWIKADTPVPVGSWAVTVSTDAEPLAVGVVSVPNRTIGQVRLVLGFNVDQGFDGDGVRVQDVMDDRGASDAGMAGGDVVVEVQGREVKRVGDIADVLGESVAGDVLTVVVLRDDERITLEVELSAAKPPDLRNMQGRISERDYGFEEIIQHDTVLQPRDCGGPIVDLEGLAIGLNIARAGRVASYALPVSQVEPALERLLAIANGESSETETESEPTSKPEAE